MLGAIYLLSFFPAEDYSSRDTVSMTLEALERKSNNDVHFCFVAIYIHFETASPGRDRIWILSPYMTFLELFSITVIYHIPMVKDPEQLTL